MDDDKKELTRYVCAAVQIDEAFCNQIIEEIVNEEHRVIGLNLGLDLPTIVKSCIFSKKRKDRRDLSLSVIFLIAAILFLVFPPLIIILYLIAWAIVWEEERTSRYDIIAKYALKNNFKPEFFESLKVEPNSIVERRLREIEEEQSGNVIIYGGFSPFVGSGINIGGWSFSINIHKAKEELGQTLQISAFQVSEMYKYITDSILKLGLTNLRIKDNLYVNGEEIRDNTLFLSEPLVHPTTEVNSSTIKHFRENPTHTVRHYRSFRVTDWKGELVLSGFLRLVIIEQSLFIEVNYCLLTPLRSYYRQFDAMRPEHDAREIWNLVQRSFWKTLGLFLASPLRGIQRKIQPWPSQKERKEKQREILRNPLFNYGAISSLRERVSQSEYRRYFQKLDQEMYIKVIERQIIDSIVNFLNSKNVDTSDLKETRTSILNHGVIVSGGSVTAHNVAVGERAAATSNTLVEQSKSAFHNISQLANNQKKE